MIEKIKANTKNVGKVIVTTALTAMFIFNLVYNPVVKTYDGKLLHVDINSIVTNMAIAEQDGVKGLCCDLWTFECWNENIFWDDTQWQEGRDFCI